MDFAWSEEQVITALTVETALAAVPVRARGRDVGRVDEPGIGIGAQQDRSSESCPRASRLRRRNRYRDPPAPAVRLVFRVPSCSIASRLQIGLQNRHLICGSPQVPVPPVWSR